MADESKLKAQAREYCKGHSRWHRFEGESVSECNTDCLAAFAHERVKAETADLRDRLADAEKAMKPLIYGCGHDADLDCPLGFDELHHFLTKLQENK